MGRFVERIAGADDAEGFIAIVVEEEGGESIESHSFFGFPGENERAIYRGAYKKIIKKIH